MVICKNTNTVNTRTDMTVSDMFGFYIVYLICFHITE